MKIVWDESRNPTKMRTVHYCVDADDPVHSNGAPKVLVFVEERLVYADGSPYTGDPKRAGRNVDVRFYVRPIERKLAMCHRETLKEAKQVAESYLDPLREW